MNHKQNKLSVAILYYSGTHEDDEDTLSGVKGIEESLKRTGHVVTKVSVTKNNWQNAIRTQGDVVFNFVEDDNWVLYEKIAYGLERLKRAQVGHDISGLPYAVKKTPLKQMMKKVRIPTPNFVVYPATTTHIDPGTLHFPVIIKPSNQHAGIGISQQSVVTNTEELSKRVLRILKEYPGDVIAEEYVAGREIHVTILGNNNNLIVLPFCEIGFTGKFKNNWSVYTYEAKWSKKTWEYDDARVEAPAKIPVPLQKQITRLTLQAYKAFHCRDITRFDVRIHKNGTPFLIDVNMNPSINFYDDQDATLASIYAKGWSYDEFIERLITITYNRLRK